MGQVSQGAVGKLWRGKLAGLGRGHIHGGKREKCLGQVPGNTRNDVTVYLGEIFLPKLTRAKQQPGDKTKGSHLTALDREYSFLQSPTSPSF